MPEHRTADGPRDESEGERRKGLQDARIGVGGGEKHRREDDTGHRPVEKEIVVLDGGSDRAGQDGAAPLTADLHPLQSVRR